MPPPALSFHPPLLNSASPWATDASHLRALLECPSTGAVTTRTSLLAGFDHQPESHRFAFFNPATSKQSGLASTHSFPDAKPLPEASGDSDAASLNNLGYSPLPLKEYLSILQTLARELPESLWKKTVIISVTGTPAEVAGCYAEITAHAGSSSSIPFPLAMEINLSCPNIPGHPPPAYEAEALASYINALPVHPSIAVGIKTPPYTHAGQFDTLISTLAETRAGNKLSFITATNTLGSCLILGEGGDAVLPGSGIGRMAGPPLHPLAVGNVATIRGLLDSADGLGHMGIIGMGGVSDGDGYKRMRAAGASAVGLATSLGKLGVAVFSNIEADIGSSW
jgi:dihydroorotate dehydrogenase (fumarate)